MPRQANPNSKYSLRKRWREFQYDKENNWSEEQKKNKIIYQVFVCR